VLWSRGTSFEELCSAVILSASLWTITLAAQIIVFEPIGFGMWADRPEMQDAAKWVTDLWEREWTR
jgi:hypothetical protein